MALHGQGAKVEIVSSSLGAIASDEPQPVHACQTFRTTASVLYDAVVVPGGAHADELARHPAALRFVEEAFVHAKPIGATNEGVALLRAARLASIELVGGKGGRVLASHGVVTSKGRDISEFTSAFVEAIRQHRHHERELDPSTS